jgi:hypothetical protein
MRIIDRIHRLDLPEKEFIVIGSGLLDVWNLRQANDIDLVVTPRLFKQLSRTGNYTMSMKYDEPFLQAEDREIWLTWGTGRDFVFLRKNALVIEGILFVHPDIIIDHKKRRGTQKDLNDIQLIERYLHDHN